MAQSWLSLMPVAQIAITGSQGKTNTSSTLFHILSSLGSTIRTDLNLDTVYNVPITSLKITPWTRYAIFELGVDHVGEMDLHLEVVRPKIAIVTGISPVHTDQEHLGSFENLIREKRKLIEALPKEGYAVLNGDDPHVRSMAKYTKATVVFYGTGHDCGIQASEISLSLNGISFNLKDTRFDPSQPRRLTRITSCLIGKHHIYNIMASYAVYRILGYTNVDAFSKLLLNLKPLPGRMSVEKGPLCSTLLNDSLRANPASTASGLETLTQLNIDGRKIAVLAEMGELEHPEVEHANIGRLIARQKIDYAVLIGPLHANTRNAAIQSGFPESRILLAEGVRHASNILKQIVKPHDLLYLKGSLLRHVERVLMLLNGKQVVCEAITCPFYHHCPECKYLQTGYPPTD